MFNLLSIPRTSWKARFAFVWLVAVISLMVQQWPYRDHELAMTRWIAWFFLVSGVLYVPKVVMGVAIGRLSMVYQRMFKGLNTALPQIQAEFVCEQRQQREGSREL